MNEEQTFPLCPPHATLARTYETHWDFGGCVQCRLNELAELRRKIDKIKNAVHEMQIYASHQSIEYRILAITDGEVND